LGIREAGGRKSRHCSRGPVGHTWVADIGAEGVKISQLCRPSKGQIGDQGITPAGMTSGAILAEKVGP
jgi:hypothetical protein